MLTKGLIGRNLLIELQMNKYYFTHSNTTIVFTYNSFSGLSMRVTGPANIDSLYGISQSEFKKLTFSINMFFSLFELIRSTNYSLFSGGYGKNSSVDDDTIEPLNRRYGFAIDYKYNLVLEFAGYIQKLRVLEYFIYNQVPVNYCFQLSVNSPKMLEFTIHWINTTFDHTIRKVPKNKLFGISPFITMSNIERECYKHKQSDNIGLI